MRDIIATWEGGERVALYPGHDEMSSAAGGMLGFISCDFNLPRPPSVIIALVS